MLKDNNIDFQNVIRILKLQNLKSIILESLPSKKKSLKAKSILARQQFGLLLIRGNSFCSMIGLSPKCTRVLWCAIKMASYNFSANICLTN